MATLTETRRQVARDLAVLEVELDLAERYADAHVPASVRCALADARARAASMRRKATELGIEATPHA